MATGDPTGGGRKERPQNYPETDQEGALYYSAAEESHILLDRVIDIGESMDTGEAVTLYRHFCPGEKQKNGIHHAKYPGLLVINYLRSEKIISITDISALEIAAIELNLSHLKEKIEEHKKMLELPVLPIKVKNSGQDSLLQYDFSAFKKYRSLRRFFKERYDTHLKACRKGCISLLMAVSSTKSLEMLKTDIESGSLSRELHSRFEFDENVETSFEEDVYNKIYQQLTLQEIPEWEALKEREEATSTENFPKSEIPEGETGKEREEATSTENFPKSEIPEGETGKERKEATSIENLSKSEIPEGETGKERKESTSTETFPKSEKKAVASVAAVLVCKEHRIKLEAICLTCYTYMCFQCAFEYHRDHQVVSPHEMEIKIHEQTQKVSIECKKVEEQLKFLGRVQMSFKEQFHKHTELELEDFVIKSTRIMKIQQQRLLEKLEFIASLGMNDLGHVKEELDEMQKETLSWEEQIRENFHPDMFTKLHDLNIIETKIRDSEQRTAEINHCLHDGLLAVSVLPNSVSANIANISDGYILGAIMASVDQVIIIRRKAILNTSINITCSSCYDSKIYFWEYTFDCKETKHPLAVANTMHICPREMGVLVGCERNISLLEVSQSNNRIFFVKKKSCVDVRIPKHSYITGISPIKGNVQDTGFMVSDKDSGVLHIFDNKYTLIREVKYPGIFSLITCRYSDNAYKYAFSSSKAESVKLVASRTTNEMPREFAKLRFPKSFNLHAQSLYFDGSFFTVLWVSGEETYSKGQEWKVVAYKTDGGELNVSKAGKCEPNVTAVSISHVKNEGLLCFSDGTVDLFQTCKT